MKNWVAHAKELLAVLEQHPTTALQTAEARDRFKEILEGASGTTYMVKHYKDPRAVIMSVEAFEAVRQLSLLVSGLVENAERQDEVEPAVGETTTSAEEWAATVAETIKATRAEPRSRRQFKKLPAAAM
jgi:hypothetical protein